MSRNERRLMLGCGGVAALLMMLTAAMIGAVGLSLLRGDDTQAGEEEAPNAAVESVAFVPEPEDEATDEMDASLSDEVRARLDALRDRGGQDSLEALPLPAPRSGMAPDLSRLYSSVNPGVVSIRVGQDTGMFMAQGTGSGFLVDEQHVVTNNHVAGPGAQVRVIFHDETEREGRVVGADAYSDLSVIRVDGVPATARPLQLVDNFDELLVGEPVVAIGNPFGFANTMTYGIISALGRTIPVDPSAPAASFSIPRTIQTDAAINPGNSGGPLLNLQGEVIGVNAQIRSNGVAANAGVGFAIPAAIVEKVVPSLIGQGEHDWSYLGVQGTSLNRDLAELNRLPVDTMGAYISQVPPGGPSEGRLQGVLAYRGGGAASPNTVGADAQAGGDVIIEIDDETVRSFDDLLSYVAIETEPGDVVELTILRDGEVIEVPLELGERPDRN